MQNPRKGCVPFTVAGTEYTLKPSLSAFAALALAYPNHLDIIRRISGNDAPTMIAVLAAARVIPGARPTELLDLLFRAGPSNLAAPLMDYVFRLFNAGRSADEINGAAETPPSAPSDRAPKKRRPKR